MSLLTGFDKYALEILNRSDLAHEASKAPAIIRVKNLQTTLAVGTDVWGREGKRQPVLVSASVSLRKPFESASEEDAVTSSTIHYGILSKKILEACEAYASTTSTAATDAPSTVTSLLDIIFHFLTHSGSPSGINFNEPPVLTSSVISSLEVTAMLPKGSLLGSGASLTQAYVYSPVEPKALSRVLALHNLSIPTLIGVNPNERLAKQIVIANIELDQWTDAVDPYPQLEQVVVKTIEESSFQTLEALATHVCQRVIKYLVIPQYIPKGPNAICPLVRIRLEKPTAVTMADAPVVELVVNSGPQVTAAFYSFQQIQDYSTIKVTKVPFPLQGKLNDWIAKEEAKA
ncbi:hypothetical protein G7Y89_g8941 [Cudoniella acicularis]|uniref:dihydroneopterin aldolase n=1 Tax=Cudoniella acicularis TaxID=354080 RepID=A0A8H4RGK7_9HELO|nr:hypothetical protein G7Y89_g8941 [Cudoniella acicularis]